MNVVDLVSSFLQGHLSSIPIEERRLLLGFSGGIDSSALLFSLLILQDRYSFALEIAHVDHQWREESAPEAEQIVQFARKHQITCHLCQLNPVEFQGNVESFCREKRLDFFFSLHRRSPFLALLLAHQRNDQEETILKQLFEGRPLLASWGMRETMPFYRGASGLSIWRPLLSLPREQLSDWVREKSSSFGWFPFSDPANTNTRYLRVRMRQSLIPTLKIHFGKEITPPLLSLCDQVQELRRELFSQINPSAIVPLSGPMGECYDLSDHQLRPLEAEMLLQYLFERYTLSFLGRQERRQVVEALLENRTERRILLGKGSLFSHLTIDRRKLFFLYPSTSSLTEEVIVLREGRARWGSLSLSIERIQSVDKQRETPFSWKDLWKGMPVTYWLSAGFPLTLSPPSPALPYPGKRKKIAHWWTNHQIPLFLRHHYPLCIFKGRVVGEFLTGRSLPRLVEPSAKSLLKVSLFRGEIVQ